MLTCAGSIMLTCTGVGYTEVRSSYDVRPELSPLVGAAEGICLSQRWLMMDTAHARDAETQPHASITHTLLCGVHDLSKAGPCLAPAVHALTTRIKCRYASRLLSEGLCHASTGHMAALGL